MQSTMAEKTHDVLYSIFAPYGFPEEIVSDNGPRFTAAVFRNFLSRNGIKQTLVPLYHPASDGAAERSVQILKRNLEKQVIQNKQHLSVSTRLANFLSAYRNTPYTVTGETPESLFLKRSPRTKLSQI